MRTSIPNERMVFNGQLGQGPFVMGPAPKAHRNRQRTMNGNAKRSMNENAKRTMNQNAKRTKNRTQKEQ